MSFIRDVIDRLLGRTPESNVGEWSILHQSFAKEFPFLAKQTRSNVLEPSMFKNEYYEGGYSGSGWQTAGYIPCFSLNELPGFYILLIVYPECKESKLLLAHKMGARNHIKWIKLEAFIQKFPDLEITKSLIFNQGNFTEEGTIPGIPYHAQCFNP